MEAGRQQSCKPPFGLSPRQLARSPGGHDAVTEQFPRLLAERVILTSRPITTQEQQPKSK